MKVTRIEQKYNMFYVFYGQIVIQNNGKGGYNIDSEYLGITKVLQIMNTAGL